MSPDSTTGPVAKSRSLQNVAPLLGLFALALLVRCIGLTWGLPNSGRWYSYHPDESTRQIVGAVVSVISGDFNPHFFNYPSLSIYATWFIYQLLAGFGLTTNAVGTAYPWPVIHDIILSGRLFSVLTGAATAPLVFLLARRLWPGRWAILAGALAALTPGHVQHSHFATVDVPATFFVVLCLVITVGARSNKALLWAGLVAGLAAGTKYNAGLVVIAPLIALWLREKGAEEGKNQMVAISLGLIVTAAAGFLLSTPYALLAPAEFWGDGKINGFAYELFVHPREGHGEIFQGTGNGWWYHLSYNLPFILTWPLIIAALWGAWLAAKRRVFWPVLVFAGLFFLSLGFSQVRFMRYLLPIAPLLCLVAAYAASRLPLSRVWSAAVLGFALWGTRDVLIPFISVDPRDQAVPTIAQRSGRVILTNNPWYYTPPFQPQGLNTAVEGVVISKNPQTDILPGDVFVSSEFEWRDAQRLKGTLSAPNWFAGRADVKTAHFKNPIPLALPGRAFVPHDYLYTNPETRVSSPAAAP